MILIEGEEWGKGRRCRYLVFADFLPFRLRFFFGVALDVISYSAGDSETIPAFSRNYIQHNAK